MTKLREAGRLAAIVEAATELFMAQGYMGTRMDQIARRAEVSAGNVYLYAESKESLFDLVLAHTVGALRMEDVEFPYRTRDRGSVIESVWERVEEIASFPWLTAASDPAAGSGPPPEDPRAELDRIVRELYGFLARYRRFIRLVQRCARDWPEIEALFYKQFRREGLGRLTAYLERRTAAGLFRRMPDTPAVARIIFEVASFFAMHRHSAVDSEMDDRVAEEAVVQFVLNALLPGPEPHGRGGSGDTAPDTGVSTT